MVIGTVTTSTGTTTTTTFGVEKVAFLRVFCACGALRFLSTKHRAGHLLARRGYESLGVVASHAGLDAPLLVDCECQLHNHCDDCDHDAHAHSHGQHFSWLLDTEALGPKALVPTLLTIVLSVHSFVAGMALGVQESSEAAVPTLIAIVVHKWVEAISLGVSVVRATPDHRALLRYAYASVAYPSVS